MSILESLSQVNGSLPSEQRGPASIDLAALYSVRRPEVIGFLVKFGVNPTEAEDITQEAFLNACNPSHQKKSPEHLYSWLLVCARNIAVDRYRRTKREIQAPAQVWKDWEETIPDPSRSAEKAFADRERFKRYLRALSQLSPLEQQIVLFRGQGRTFREIGAALDIPLRSAVYAANVAVEKLQQILL